MKRTLIVVDMQNDFISMALGTNEAKAIVPNVKAKIEEYIKNGDEVIFTRDTHSSDYLNTPEGKKLPVPHCIKGIFPHPIASKVLKVGKLPMGYTLMVAKLLISQTSVGHIGKRKTWAMPNL